MKKELRDRWTAALRSGEYQQGKHQFERNGRYCCLGVLCDVVGAPTTIVGSIGNWPLVRDLLDDNGRGETVHELAALNDGGTTFPEIADWIEQNVGIK